MEGIGLVNIALNSWLKKYDFDVRARGLDDGFYWYCQDDTIGYNFTASTLQDETWINLLNTLGLKYTIDSFWTIFLHEVFHSETYHYFTKEELDNYSKEVRLLGEHPELFEDPIETYYHLPVELIATESAVEYINTYPERIEELSKIAGSAIRTLFKINNIEDDE